MFYYISGKLSFLDPAFAVIDAGGVGYKLSISLTTYTALSNTTLSNTVQSENTLLYTHMAVREDGVELYGFSSNDELDAFKLLITVSGVGPKAAMAILSQMTPQKLSVAICSEDKKSISQANGIGPKTAARIILELKDKLSKAPIAGMPLDEDVAPIASSNMNYNKLTDAQDALVALGYSKNEAYSVLKTIDTEKYELDEIIRLALKKIMR